MVSWQLYGNENLSPSGGSSAFFRTKRFEAAVDADFSYLVLLTEVSSGFLSSKRCLQHVKSLFSFHLQFYALELHSGRSCSSLTFTYYFLLVLFVTPGQNTSLLGIITVFSRHVKMELSKTNTPLMIYTRGSQRFSYHVPLQHSDKWACTPTAFQQIRMYPFRILTDEHVPLKLFMTKYFLMIFHRYI